MMMADGVRGADDVRSPMTAAEMLNRQKEALEKLRTDPPAHMTPAQVRAAIGRIETAIQNTQRRVRSEQAQTLQGNLRDRSRRDQVADQIRNNLRDGTGLNGQVSRHREPVGERDPAAIVARGRSFLSGGQTSLGGDGTQSVGITGTTMDAGGTGQGGVYDYNQGPETQKPQHGLEGANSTAASLVDNALRRGQFLVNQPASAANTSTNVSGDTMSAGGGPGGEVFQYSKSKFTNNAGANNAGAKNDPPALTRGDRPAAGTGGAPRTSPNSLGVGAFLQPTTVRDTTHVDSAGPGAAIDRGRELQNEAFDPDRPEYIPAGTSPFGGGGVYNLVGGGGVPDRRPSTTPGDARRSRNGGGGGNSGSETVTQAETTVDNQGRVVGADGRPLTRPDGSVIFHTDPDRDAAVEAATITARGMGQGSNLNFQWGQDGGPQYLGDTPDVPGPTFWNVTGEELVENRLENLMSKDNPVFQEIQERTRRAHAKFGGQNSLMANQAAVASMAQMAFQIASEDAKTIARSREFNAAMANQYGLAQQTFIYNALLSDQNFEQAMEMQEAQLRAQQSASAAAAGAANAQMQAQMQFELDRMKLAAGLELELAGYSAGLEMDRLQLAGDIDLRNQSLLSDQGYQQTFNLEQQNFLNTMLRDQQQHRNSLETMGYDAQLRDWMESESMRRGMALAQFQNIINRQADLAHMITNFGLNAVPDEARNALYNEYHTFATAADGQAQAFYGDSAFGQIPPWAAYPRPPGGAPWQNPGRTSAGAASMSSFLGIPGVGPGG